MLRDGFLRLLEELKAKLPDTTITVLTNGRTFADAAFTQTVARIRHPKLRLTIPLHADVPEIHDHIAQAKGAFVETLGGLYNLEANGIDVEIRVVLHALSVPRLAAMAEYIYRKAPFVRQVVFMGLENMGYVKKNWSQLWIDPLDYATTLRKAVEHLYRRGMGVSVYNLPLCVLPGELWGFARRSISDHKQTLVDECTGCNVMDHCAGIFVSGRERRSRGIHPIALVMVRGAGPGRRAGGAA